MRAVLKRFCGDGMRIQWAVCCGEPCAARSFLPRPQSEQPPLPTLCLAGVRAQDLENAWPFETVQAWVRKVLANRLVVGHGLRSDFQVSARGG